ncbi:MAG: ATPase, T2SS/T4P/T4SS family [Persicimonas sp.]
MVTVTISEKGGQQSQYDFNQRDIAIGRMKDNDIVLPKGNVSKKHARLINEDGTLLITDLNSTNGTYVNGRKVTDKQPVSESDKIYIGDFILQVEATESAGEVAQNPPQPPAGQADGGGGGSLPPSPPSSPDASDMRKTIGASPGAEDSPGAVSGDGAVDDLFAAGDSKPQVAEQPNPGPPRARSSTDADSSAAGRAGGDAAGSSDSALDFDGLDLGGPSGPNDAGAATGEREDRAVERAPSSGASNRAPAADRQVRPQEEQVHASAPSHTGRLPSAPDFESEFDDNLFEAHRAAAQAFFEAVGVDDLPLGYPPRAADRDAYANHVDAALDSSGAGAQADELRDLLLEECVGLGPIEAHLDDPQVSEIFVNRYDQVLVRRAGKMLVARQAFGDPRFLTLAAQRLLGTRDTGIGADEVRFGDGTRVHVVLPPVAVDGPVLTVRKPPTSHPSLADLVSQQAMSPGMREFLERAVQAGRSILVAGPTSSGKSTLLGAIARQIPDGTRVVCVEESTRLELGQNSAVRLETEPAAGFDMRFLVRTAVQMQPERIIVDVCRGAEAYDWVTAAASGTDGSMLTSHGTSASDALGRLESLCLLGNPEISPRGLREQIARAVDFVVVVHRRDAASFRVRQITEVQGVDLDAFRLNDIFYHRVEGSEENFHPTGYIPLFYEDLRHAGVEVDFDIFRE